MPQYSNLRVCALSACLLPILLLSGCTQLASLPYPTKARPLSPNTPGVAVSQTRPPRLESIAFFSNTPFKADRIEPCIKEYLPAPDDDTNAVVYFGRDVVNTPGMLRVNKRQLGLLPSEYQIAFKLAVLGQTKGTRYGFSQLRLARSDALDLNNHDFTSIAPATADAQQVYQSLKALYEQLDECMAGPLSARQQ